MKTILVVEDEGPILHVLRMVLADEGYRVETARNGIEGLEKAASLTPGLVLSDVMMPRMTGPDLALALAADPVLWAVPVILMSAAGRPVGPVPCAAFLPKPFGLDELLDSVATHVGG